LLSMDSKEVACSKNTPNKEKRTLIILKLIRDSFVINGFEGRRSL